LSYIILIVLFPVDDNKAHLGM